MRTIEEINARLSAIAQEVENATGDALTALETEANELLAERSRVEAEATRRQQLRSAVAAGTVSATTVETARTMPTGSPVPGATGAEQRTPEQTAEQARLAQVLPGVAMEECRSFASYVRGAVAQMRSGE